MFAELIKCGIRTIMRLLKNRSFISEQSATSPLSFDKVYAEQFARNYTDLTMNRKQNRIKKYNSTIDVDFQAYVFNNKLLNTKSHSPV